MSVSEAPTKGQAVKVVFFVECAKRWQNNLDPKLDHKEWNIEEDKLLIRSVAKHGRAWKMIQKASYPSRSRNELKNRYFIITRESKGQKDKASTRGASTSSTSTPRSRSHSEIDLDSEESSDEESPLPWGHYAPMNEEQEQNNINPWLNFQSTESSHGPGSSSSHPGLTSAEAIGNAYNVGMSHIFRPGSLDDQSSLQDLMAGPYKYQYEGTAYASEQNDWSETAGMEGIAYSVPEPNGQNSRTNHTSAQKSFGKVLVEIENCDRGTLDSILNITKTIKSKAKIEIAGS
ncbi:Myb-like protein AA [Paramyrothecium foliicola]|nr:Myb-like protein AA [Paramyrothecium foliicola]